MHSSALVNCTSGAELGQVKIQPRHAAPEARAKQDDDKPPECAAVIMRAQAIYKLQMISAFHEDITSPLTELCVSTMCANTGM